MKYNYKLARAFCYPCLHDFVQAHYPYASGGDATKKAALDAHIALVDAAIPADATVYTEEEIIAKKDSLKDNAAWIKMTDENYWYKTGF